MTDFLHKEQAVQIMPVMLSPFTDPLCHDVEEASIDYYGQKLFLTKSMIFHKQIAVLAHPKTFVFSPNVRLEKSQTTATGRHLIEFTQLDMEFKDWTKEDFIEFTEKLIVHSLKTVKKDCKKELALLGRRLEVPKTPFPRRESKKLKQCFGRGFEQKASESEETFFWVLDHKREFYDREDEEGGYFHNYDLIYPHGFGEALSGGEREVDYERLLERMGETRVSIQRYSPYLEMAKAGLLRKSAGGGLGIERFVRYCAGVRDISQVALFPRTPGKKMVV
jgi:asparaginyl-tRNA synthetase